MMKLKNFKGEIILTITALIWGTAFVAQSMGMKYTKPFTFNGVRTVVGGIALLPVILFMSKSKGESPKKEINDNKLWIRAGIECGLALLIASSLQQVGMQYTTAGKAGFLTALYIIIVPILGLFLKKKVRMTVWLSVAIATIGTYFLSVKQGFNIGIGDIYIILCAFGFSVQIMIVDKYASLTNAVKLSCTQFFVCGISSVIIALIFEKPQFSQIMQAAAPILYAGVMSSGVAYTLQIIGQRYTEPAIASLIMSMESVYAALGGWLILNEQLTGKELFGCALVFTAIIITQIPKKGSSSRSFEKIETQQA